MNSSNCACYKKEIYFKIELLCYGLKTNENVEKIYDQQNPFDLTRTGNVGLQLLLGTNELVANVPVFNKFTQNSPYFIKEEFNQYYVVNEINGDRIIIRPIQTPNWYFKNVDSNKYAGQYLLREGLNTLICSVTDSCCYVYDNKQCKFCAIGSNALKNVQESALERKENIIKSILYALNDLQEDEKSINLTGGNSYSKDRGAAKYVDYVSAIRNKSNIKICIELSPPSEYKSLDDLKRVGVDAVMMNIEIWDEKIRKIIMPGKSIITRDEYIKMWKHAVNIFGKGNVSSVIIIGFESVSSVKAAIDEMTKIGVMPSIMPFRPNDGAILENFSIANPSIIEHLTEYASKKAIENKIIIDNAPGCIGCGACAAELDYINIKGEN